MPLNRTNIRDFIVNTPAPAGGRQADNLSAKYVLTHLTSYTYLFFLCQTISYQCTPILLLLITNTMYTNVCVYDRIRAVIEGGQIDGEMRDSANQAALAWLGFYNGYYKKLNWNTGELITTAKVFARSLGLDDIPGIPKRTLAKMGLTVSVLLVLL